MLAWAGMPPYAAQLPRAMRTLTFFRISSSTCLCSVLRTPPETMPTSASGISRLVPSPSCPNYVWSTSAGMCTKFSWGSKSNSASPVLRMEISQPEQAFNHSDATFTAISRPPLRSAVSFQLRTRCWLSAGPGQLLSCLHRCQPPGINQELTVLYKLLHLKPLFGVVLHHLLGLGLALINGPVPHEFFAV